MSPRSSLGAGNGRRGLAAAALALSVVLPLAAPAFAQTTFNCRILARIDSLPGEANDVFGYTDPRSGREYAIIGTEFGTGIYDVTVPAAAALAGFIPGPRSAWRDFDVYRTYLYAGSEGGGGVQIIDLADPRFPSLLGAYTGAGLSTSHTIVADTAAARLYVNGTPGGMRILSLADPTAPVEIGVYPAPYVHDAYARNDTVYASCIGVGQEILLDARDPAALDTIALFTTERAKTHSSWPTEGGTHLLVADETRGGRITSWDITDPEAPVQVDGFTADPQGDAHNVYVRGRFAFVSHYTSGLWVLDVSDPTRLDPVGFADTYPEPGGFFDGAWSAFPFTASGNVYVGDIQSGLFVVSFNGRRAAGIAGVVTERGTGGPLAGVEVRLVEAARSVRTDALGRFVIRTAEGTHTIVASGRGLVDTTFVVTLPAGESVPIAFAMLDNTADVAVAPESGIAAVAPAGGAAEAVLVVRNAGGGLLRYTIRDEHEVTSGVRGARAPAGREAARLLGARLAEARQAVSRAGEPRAAGRRAAASGAARPGTKSPWREAPPPLRRILSDPRGDPILIAPEEAPPADLVALWAGAAAESLALRCEVAAPPLPESLVVLAYLDVDQDATTGVRDPLAAAFGLTPANDVGAELLLVWDLTGRLIPLPGGAPGGVALLAADLSAFSSLFTSAVDSAGATVVLDPAADIEDEGNMNVAAAALTVSFREVPFEPLSVDPGPNAGHAIVGVERTDAPWIVASPDTGSLRGGEEAAVRILLDASSLDADTALAGTIIVSTNDEDEPLVAVPVALRVFVPDTTPPGITLSILQNPILPRYVGVVLVADEPLAGAPALAASGELVLLAGEARAARPEFRGNLALPPAGEVTLSLTASDTAGNETRLTETIIAYEAPASGTARAGGPRAAFAIEAPEGALPRGALLVLRAPAEDRFVVGPEGLALAGEVALEVPRASGRIVRIEGSRAVPLETYLARGGHAILARTDRVGTFEVREEGAATLALLPDRPRLAGVTPNPTRGGASIAFVLPTTTLVRLDIFDVSGRRVRTLVSGSLPPGPHAAWWDGAGAGGHAVTPGIYLARLAAPGGSDVRKAVVLR